jgi:hypothetical protein
MVTRISTGSAPVTAERSRATYSALLQIAFILAIVFGLVP